MSEHPVYLRMPTENDQPYFERHSCAEVVIGAVIKAQQSGWMRLHGFVVLPEALEMVVTPIKFSLSTFVGHLESETIPLLSILVPQGDLIWSPYFLHTPLETQRALDARLNILLLSPVAAGLAESASAYAYSSANPRYMGAVVPFAGYQTQTSAAAAPTQ